MPSREDIILLARYNERMNHKLYQAAGKLSPSQVRLDRGAFFGSLLGTLNHLIAADTIWLTRFAWHASNFHALASLRCGPVPTDLTQSYGTDVFALQAHRTRLDQVINGLAEEVCQADLDQALAYRNTRGIEFRKNFGSLLLHFFNHQTHHRGQATTMLTQAGVDVGVTDLLDIIADTEN